jgi:hypothetical protein
LDAAGRLAAWTTEAQGTDGTWTGTGSKANHYGDLGAVTSATGDTLLAMTDLHGDVTVQLPLDTSKSPTASAHDEYGNPEGSTAGTATDGSAANSVRLKPYPVRS